VEYNIVGAVDLIICSEVFRCRNTLTSSNSASIIVIVVVIVVAIIALVAFIRTSIRL